MRIGERYGQGLFVPFGLSFLAMLLITRDIALWLWTLPLVKFIPVGRLCLMFSLFLCLCAMRPHDNLSFSLS